LNDPSALLVPMPKFSGTLSEATPAFFQIILGLEIPDYLCTATYKFYRYQLVEKNELIKKYFLQ
jgi:hypothetical protein